MFFLCKNLLLDSNSISPQHDSSVSSLVSTPLIKSMSQIHLDVIRRSTSKSLFDEYTNAFDSKKTPMSDKRRTLGNITMDIIRQRVENINRIAQNRSNSESFNDSIHNDIKSTPVGATATKTSSKNDEQIANTSTSNDIEIITDNAKPKPMKRKLFAPPSLFPDNFDLFTTPLKTDKKISSKSSTQKRKRNDLPAETEKAGELQRIKTKSRRSTLFFETPPTAKAQSIEHPSKSVPNIQNKNPNGVMVYTSMHQPQIDFIKEVRQG